MVNVIIVAAGTGSRFGAGLPKQFLPLGAEGLPVLMHSVNAFIAAGIPSENIRVVISPEMTGFWEDLCREHRFVSPPVVEGGPTRFHSVRNAVTVLRPECSDVVLIHDGARPLVSVDLIRRVVAAVRIDSSAIPVVPVTDSLRKTVSAAGTSLPPSGICTVAVNRKDYFAVQTPQGFKGEMLAEAYKTDYNESFTDDASVVEARGNTVVMVEGEADNIKITHPRDLVIAEALLESRSAVRADS